MKVIVIVLITVLPIGLLIWASIMHQKYFSLVIEEKNPKKSKGGESEDKDKASLFDDEIVRSGLDSKKKKKDTFKDKLKRGANWAMNIIVDRN